MSTPNHIPVDHLTITGLYMFMLCYKNGGL